MNILSKEFMEWVYRGIGKALYTKHREDKRKIKKVMGKSHNLENINPKSKNLRYRTPILYHKTKKNYTNDRFWHWEIKKIVRDTSHNL